MGPTAAIALPPQMAVPTVIRNEAVLYLQPTSDRQPKEHGSRYAARGVKEARAANLHHLRQVHAKAETYH
jgi:hypothetical protein